MIVEAERRLEIDSPVRPGLRIVFAVLALVPWLAPYELLWSIEWRSWLHPFFLLALVVSAGAILLSAFLAFAAVAALATRIVLDAESGTITETAVAPAVPLRTRVRPLSTIREVAVDEREDSDGPPRYALRIVVDDAVVFETASSPTRREIEQARERVEAFLARHSAIAS